MSPKYPISVTITEDSVRFRVHYSAYKCKHEQKGYDIESYSYKIDEAFKKDPESTLRHMEEVLIELNFSNDSTDELYQSIQTLYYTKYPYLLLEKPSDERKENNKEGTKDEKTTFIHSLIQKRYGGGNTKPIYNNDIEEELYLKLRENQDQDSSYSTLWLMDIISNNEKESINLFDGDIVVKFLRKLLLDFMFDLKHSDVFQTSKYYQTMNLGLMANFYFSALIHKCEYYFYRGLINDVIRRQVSSEDTRIKHISHLYAERLAQAESLWIQDIQDPRSDKFFEYDCPKFLYDKIDKELKRNTFQNHMSWFTEPEEELRRVCFTMKDNEGSQHICNVDTLIEFLNCENANISNIDNLKSSRDKNRIMVSKWFLNRYDFSDLLHFHLFKYANIFYFALSFIAIFYLYIDPNAIGNIASFINNIRNNFPPNVANGYITYLNTNFCPLVLLIGFVLSLLFVWHDKDYLIESISNRIKIQTISGARKRIVWKRVTLWIVIQLLIIMIVCLCIFFSKWFLVLFVPILYITIKVLVPYLHLLYPRLVASIVTAWLTLAAGNDLFAAFFDSIISPIMIICLSVIVFIFVLYEINRIVPKETTINKLYRSFELTIIGYSISLIVGAVVINFTGERILERSGVMEAFYSDYVSHNDVRKVEDMAYEIDANTIPKLLVDKFNDKERVERLKDIKIKKKDGSEFYPISSDIPMGSYTFFFLRDFWIQFSFVAMFIGIFIQMIFEEKRITEI